MRKKINLIYWLINFRAASRVYTLELCLIVVPDKEMSVSCCQCLPVYSGKQIVKGDLVIFSANRSFLLRKRIIDVSVNHLLLQIESNSFILSIIRFWNRVKGILLNTIVTFDTTRHIETLETRIKGKISFHAGDHIVWNLIPSSWKF